MLSRLILSARGVLAAASNGWPGRKLKVVIVTGPDSSATTVSYLAEVLKTTGERVGVISPQYVEIAGERVQGSDQGAPYEDIFRLNALLSQMRRARCNYVLIELPGQLPAHQFRSISLAMLVVRRCGDAQVEASVIATRLAAVSVLVQRTPAVVVFPKDDPCSPELQKLASSGFAMTYGADSGAECRIQNVQLHPKGSALDLVIDHQTTMQLTTNLAGKQAIYSATAAAAAAYLLHVAIDHIEEGIAQLPVQPLHMEYLPIPRPYTIVLDSSVTPDGIVEVLDAVKHFTKNRVIALLGAPASNAAWRSRLAELVADRADRLIITDGEYQADESPAAVRTALLKGVETAGASARTDEIENRAEALEKALSIARRGDTIVVCSVTPRPYRQMGSERVTWSDRNKVEELIG